MKLLIKNAQIKTMEREDFIGDLLIEEGRIVEIAGHIEAGSDIPVINGTGYLLTPGLIDGHCHTGILEEGIGAEGNDVNETGDPITPQHRAIDGINPMAPEFHEALEGGVTSAMIAPGSLNVIGGQAAIIKTAGRCIDKMIVKAPAAMKIAFGENPKKYYGGKGKSPATRMGIAGLLRETLFEAQNYYNQKKEKKVTKPDFKMEALLPVFTGEIPLKAHAHRADDIFTAIHVAKEFNLKLTIDHCTEGHLIAEELAEAGYSIFLGPTFGGKIKYELRNTSFSTAKVLHEAGLKFGIVTDAYVIPLKHLSLCAALAVNAGLPEDVAWRAITLTPAEILDISDRCGSLKEGKDADMVLFSGNPLAETEARAVLTIVNGEPVYSDGTVWQAI